MFKAATHWHVLTLPDSKVCEQVVAFLCGILWDAPLTVGSTESEADKRHERLLLLLDRILSPRFPLRSLAWNLDVRWELLQNCKETFSVLSTNRMPNYELRLFARTRH